MAGFGGFRAGVASWWSCRRASRITSIAEAPNIAAMQSPIAMSGHADAVTATPPAANRTPAFAMTSLREQSQAERILTSSALGPHKSTRTEVLAASARRALHRVRAAVGT